MRKRRARCPAGRFTLPKFANTIFAGFYVYDMVSRPRVGQGAAAAVVRGQRRSRSEGDLQYPSRTEAKTALGIERILDALPAVAVEQDSNDRSELGPSLLLLTLLLVLGEATLARFVAARRS